MMRAAVVVALLAVAVSADSLLKGDSRCPGVCQDALKIKCAGGAYQTGLCPGHQNIRCCVPDKPAAQRGTCSGKCQDKSTPCGKPYLTGLCPGGVDMQCCPEPNVPANAHTPPPPQTPVQPSTAGWAPFATIWKNYPNGEAEDVKRRIGGQINAAWITNTCTVRVTRALTLSGMQIKPITLSTGKPLLLVPGGNGVGLAVRVKEFSEWVSARFGKPTIKVVNAGDGTLEIPDKFKGKKGLIKFDVRIWSDATGHFDLWDGDACAHQCYFDKAREVWLWEIA